MLDVDLDVQHRRNLLYRGYGTRIEATFHKSIGNGRDIPLASLFSRLTKYAPRLLLYLRQAELKEDGEVVCLIRDVRGRPPESFSGSTASQLTNKKSEELFYSEGTLFHPPANLEDYPSEVHELEQQPFAIEVNSSFHSFTDDNHIQHSVRREVSHALSQTLGEFDLELLARLFPAEMHRLRFGIEYFKQRRATLLAGILPPSVQTRFFLELSPDSLYFLLEEESGGTRGELPQFEGNFLQALDQSLDELDLYVGLSEQVLTRL